MPAMRLNARLDDEAQKQVEYLKQATGQSVSAVVREAIAVYHVQVRSQQTRPPSRFLALAGTVRSGRSDIASNVKAVVADAIDAKFARSHPKRRA